MKTQLCSARRIVLINTSQRRDGPSRSIEQSAGSDAIKVTAVLFKWLISADLDVGTVGAHQNIRLNTNPRHDLSNVQGAGAPIPNEVLLHRHTATTPRQQPYVKSQTLRTIHQQPYIDKMKFPAITLLCLASGLAIAAPVQAPDARTPSIGQCQTAEIDNRVTLPVGKRDPRFKIQTIGAPRPQASPPKKGLWDKIKGIFGRE